MSNLMAPTQYTEDGHKGFLAQRQSPEWLNELRRLGWQAFSELEWPARNSEEWSRTDFRSFKLERYAVAGAEDSAGGAVKENAVKENAAHVGLLAAGVTEAGDSLAGQVISADGQTLHTEFNPKWAERGVIFGSLEEIARQHGEMLKEHLMQRVFDSRYDRFAALHTAFLSGGAVLYVPRGVAVSEPFHVQSMLSGDYADFSHLLIVLEEGAEATLMSEYGGADPDRVACTVAESRSFKMLDPT